jgi:hypothetical protein
MSYPNIVELDLEAIDSTMAEPVEMSKLPGEEFGERTVEIVPSSLSAATEAFVRVELEERGVEVPDMI